ncbi:PTPRU-like protein [Mya arenaria]|uniref:PTPRU-like protein n=1 Tax=Mya arenaria TaxID=6604 RepID=A0ABY7F4X9_MYAAR|nr:PTPRU-like protein [Mya arenaria]
MYAVETEVEQQPSSIEALGGGICGGVVALAVIVVVGLCLLRRRRSKLSKKETENLSALYATLKKGRASRAGNANADTDNFHSVIIIENPDYESLLTDEDDIIANETAKLYVEGGGVHYNNAREVSKLNVSDLPEHVQNISLKELEEEFQLSFIAKWRFRIYADDDTRVLVRGGETDYINASYIDGFRRRNAYISTLGPMAKQLGDFSQFWGMVWQQEVEKIVMLTNLVEGEEAKCELYWPYHYQRKIYGDIEVMCNNYEVRSLHHLQFTSWPAKDVPDNVTSLIELRQRVNALPSTFNGPVIVHCRLDDKLCFRYIYLSVLSLTCRKL